MRFHCYAIFMLRFDCLMPLFHALYAILLLLRVARHIILTYDAATPYIDD